MSAKKIETRLPYWVPPVELYLNDITDILSAVKRVLGDVVIEIGDGAYHYDSLDELVAQRGAKRIHCLSISASGSDSPKDHTRVSFSSTIGREGTSLDVIPESSSDAREVYHSVRSILDERKRWTASLLGCQRLFSLKNALFLVAVIAAAAIILCSLGSFMLANVVFAPLWLLTIFGLLLMPIEHGWGSRVHLYLPHEKAEGFISRHRDTILVAAICSAITAIVTLAVSFAWNRLAGGP